MAPLRRSSLPAIVSLLLLLAFARPAGAYSVLTHEELIDLTWADSIRPLLLERYPTLTPAQLREARAYAYGGCVIQDLGYYPFGQALLLRPPPLRPHRRLHPRPLPRCKEPK